MILRNLKVQDSGVYRCVAVNQVSGANRTASHNITLRVTSPPGGKGRTSVTLLSPINFLPLLPLWSLEARMSLPTVEASFRKSNQLSNQNHLRDVTNGLAHAAMGRQEKMNILPALFFFSLFLSFALYLIHSLALSLHVLPSAVNGAHSQPMAVSLRQRP